MKARRHHEHAGTCCAPIPLLQVTGNDLAYQVGKVYPRNARVLLWFLLEMSVLAADIQETVGCALAVQILSNGIIPLWASCILISVAAFLLLQVGQGTGHALTAAQGLQSCVDGLIPWGGLDVKHKRALVPTESGIQSCAWWHGAYYWLGAGGARAQVAATTSAALIHLTPAVVV